MNWLKKILYGPRVDKKRLDQLAQARPHIHESFEEMSKRLSGGNSGH